MKSGAVRHDILQFCARVLATLGWEGFQLGQTFSSSVMFPVQIEIRGDEGREYVASGNRSDKLSADFSETSKIDVKNRALHVAFVISWRGPQAAGTMGTMFRGSDSSGIGVRLSWRRRVHRERGPRCRSTSRRVFDRGRQSGGDACCARPHRTRPAFQVG